MPRTNVTWLLRYVAILIAAIALLGDSRPVFAGDSHCFEDLGACYQEAATRDSMWSMWLAGMDCEVSFVSCLRDALIK